MRAAVVHEALSWIGTPYHTGARLKSVGTDCGMFLAEVRISHLHHDRDVQLLQSYLRLIDPLVSNPAPPAPGSHT